MNAKPCPDCGLVFSGRAELKAHRSTVHTLHCNVCDRLFESDYALAQHFLHSSSHPTCARCSIGFEDEFALELHRLDDHDSAVCETCDLAVSLDGLDYHHFKSSKHPTCNMCAIGFKDLVEFSRHCAEFHPESFCAPCKKLLDRPIERDLHFFLSSEHPMCFLCHRSFVDNHALDSHECAVAKRAFNNRYGPQSFTSITPPSGVERSSSQSTTLFEASESDILSPAPRQANIVSFNGSRNNGSIERAPSAPASIPSTSVYSVPLRESNPGISDASNGPTRHVESRPSTLQASDDDAESVASTEVGHAPSSTMIENSGGRTGTTSRTPSNRSITTIPLPDHGTNQTETGSPQAGRPATHHHASPMVCRLCRRDPSQEATTSVQCGHIFCSKCITDEVVKNTCCPICGVVALTSSLIRLHIF